MMNKSKRICFIVPTLEMGGMERVVSLISNYALIEGYKVYILCLLNSQVQFKLHEGISVIMPSFKHKQSLATKYRVFRYLISSLKEIKPDAALSFSEVFNPLSIITAKTVRVPIYITDRSNPKKKLGFVTQLLRKVTYPFANGMIAQTTYSKEVALSRGYNKEICVIPNPLIDFKSSITTTKKNVIISMGRLIPSKNFEELINIFSECDHEEGWELWILGEGPQKKYLQQRIDKLGLTDRVKLFGMVKNIEEYFSKASIFAFTSISEGYPNALSEALAFPLPCIAYNCPAGPADLIKHGENGFLIPLNDRTSFRHYLSKLMNDEHLQEQLTGSYLYHRERHRVSTIAQKYINFISS